MKRGRLLMALGMAAMLFLLSCAGKGKHPTSGTKGEVPSVTEAVLTQTPEGDKGLETTVLIYMIGSDLEASGAAATEDIAEIEGCGLDPRKERVLLFTGGSELWHCDIPNDKNAILELRENGFEVLETFSDASMGEADTLTFFLQYGVEKYPTDRFELILWDHGNGPVMGYGNDRLHENDALTLPELSEALKNSPFGTEKKLGLIGFDACFMASAELALVVSGYADYLVASQEAEPSFGWNYAFLSGLSQKTDSELAVSIVDSYLEYHDAFSELHSFYDAEVTLSVVRLSKGNELEQKLNRLFQAASQKVSGGFRSLIRERVSARNLGRASTGSEYDLVDLWNLAELMQEDFPEECRELLQTLSEMIVYNKTNAEQCNGMSLFYPFYNKNYYELFWREDYEKIGILKDYLSYLKRYETVWLSTTQEQVFQTTLTPEQMSEQTFSLPLSKEQQECFAKAGFYVLERLGEDFYRPVYFSYQVTEENGVLSADFDGNVIVWKDRFGRSGNLLLREQDSVEDSVFFSTAVIFRRGDVLHREYKNVEIQMVADQKTKQVDVLSIYEQPTGETKELQTGKRQYINPEEWSIFEVPQLSGRYLTRDDNGNLLPFFSWPSNTVLEWEEIAFQDELTFSYQHLAGGEKEYYLAFEILDLQGNTYCSELLPIAVAETEASGEERPVETICFTQEDACIVCQKEGVTVTLVKALDLTDGRPLLKFFLKNATGEAVSVNFSELCINETYVYPRSIYLSAEAGAEGASTDAAFLDLLAEACEGLPEKLTFSITIKNSTKGGTIAWQERKEVVFENNTMAAVFLPVLGAAANRQTLFEDAQRRISLVAFGEPLTRGTTKLFDSSMETGTQAMSCLEIVNNTGETISVVLSAMVVNGTEFSIGEEAAVPAGTKVCLTGKKNLGTIKGQNVEGITSLSYKLTINGEESVYPVKLSEERVVSGNQEKLSGRLQRLITEHGLTLYDSYGIRAVLYAGKNSGGADSYWISWENTRDFTVYATLQGITVNGTVFLPAGGRERLAAGETRERSFSSEIAELILAGCDDISSMEAAVLLQAGNTVEETVPVSLLESPAQVRGYYLEPVLGALAREQSLLSEKNLRISCSGLGQQKKGYMLELPLCVENCSGQKEKVRIEGISCNGIFVPVVATLPEHLGSGERAVTTVQILLSELEKRNISAICEIKLLVSVEEKPKGGKQYHWCPVVLSQKAAVEQEVPKGRLLQSLEGVSVYLLEEAGKRTSENYYEWRLLIHNESEREIRLAVVYPSFSGVEEPKAECYVGQGECGANTKGYAVLYYNKKGDEAFGTEVEFQFSVRSLDNETVYQTSKERIVLTVVQQEEIK